MSADLWMCHKTRRRYIKHLPTVVVFRTLGHISTLICTRPRYSHPVYAVGFHTLSMLTVHILRITATDSESEAQSRLCYKYSGISSLAPTLPSFTRRTSTLG